MMAKALEEAGQLRLPFMKRLPLSPKAEQTSQLVQGLEGLTSASRTPRPWDRLLELINNFEGVKPAPGLGIKSEGGKITAGYKGSGSPSALWADFTKNRHAPERIHLDYMASDAQARTDPFGSQFSREGRTKDVPPVNLTNTQRQQGVDRIMDILRQAGFKSMDFDAVPGGRPRLYKQLTGYEPKNTGGGVDAYPAWSMDISSPAQRELPLRGKGAAKKADAPAQARTARSGWTAESHPNTPSALAWMRELNTTEPITPFYMENALGMSAEEALDLGLAREHEGNLFITDAGLRSVREWLGGR
jgi:hypothetical protein